MRLTQARVQHFKSIDDSGVVTIDPKVTVLVGQNEAGKTAFLQALEKARAVRSGVQFDVTEDYPRKGVNEYRKRHGEKPDVAVVLTYELTPKELDAVNSDMGAAVLKSPTISLTHRYDGSSLVGITVDEPALVKSVVKNAKLPAELGKAAGAAPTVRALIKVLEQADLNAEGEAFLGSLQKRFATALKSKWAEVVAYEVWNDYLGTPPKFLYFGDYQLMPGKVNLTSLQQRVSNPAQLTDEDQTTLRLLSMADVDLNELLTTTGYEEAKSRLEGLSNSITDQVFEFWTQNRELEVEFDIKNDPADPDPRFQNGPNLYIRIRNRRHRVTVPFSQRSKGFIWFFSFLVWFDSVRAESKNAPVVLLLDEPGLSLHALAQGDLLRYIDSLADRDQVLYTTHSPFMVHGERLHQVRLVEDKPKEGTTVTDNVMGSDPKTVFPLQAALGYTVAQNLFISKRNLVVEGAADLIYLQYFSSQLEAVGRTGLRDSVTIMPVGGLDKLATFIALLGGNDLEMAVIHDLASRPDTRLESMVRERLIRDRQLLNYGMFREDGSPTPKKAAARGGAKPAEEAGGDGTPRATDVEDLMSPDLYLSLFNGAFAKQLAGRQVTEANLPKGDRIVERLERYLKAEGITLRPSGGFNHYTPASYLASNPMAPDEATLERFERLFKAVNALF